MEQGPATHRRAEVGWLDRRVLLHEPPCHIVTLLLRLALPLEAQVVTQGEVDARW